MLETTENPILFIVFNRLDTTKQVFEVIQQAKPKRLYIASDGPRSGTVDEGNKVQIVRDYVLSNINWPCEVKTLFQNKNLGCKFAVSSAITWFFENEKQGIILEDDCLPEISFFQFCDELLEKYKNEENVAMIGGNNFSPYDTKEASYYFSKIPHIWGWATWKRTWNKYDITMSKYPDFKKNGLIKDIWSNKKVQNYWLGILNEVYDNKVNTWDYQLTFSIFTSQSLCICPKVNLVSNIGFGKNVTNTVLHDNRVANINLDKMTFPLKHPISLEYKEENDKHINDIYLKYYKTKIILKKLGIFALIKKIYIYFQSMIK